MLSFALGAAAGARADISEIMLSVRAVNSTGVALFEVRADQANYDPKTGSYSWSLAEPIDLVDDQQQVVARLEELETLLVGDPLIDLSFRVTGGSGDTTFTITSALLSFPGIFPAEGRARASVTATDLTGDGVALTALQPNSAAYLAQYDGLVPAGTTFAALVGNLTAGPGGSVTGAQSQPLSGFELIPVPVSDMSAQFMFRLTANDEAEGSSTFEVVPEPASLALFVVVLAGAARRRFRSCRGGGES